MDNQQRQGPGLPISGGAVVIALILGSLFVQQLAFKGSRPWVPGHGINTSASLEDVQARLWEDPFAAVRRHRTDAKGGRHKIESLAEQIVRKKTDEVTVLGVMVFGGPYAKDAERRIRSRHATLSALGALDYVPDNAEHLGYIKTDRDKGNATEEGLPEIVPYEWFVPGFESKHKLKRTILVLWLDDDAFYPTPLTKIGKLKSRLQGEVKKSDKSEGPKIKFKILGPAGSTNLHAMMDEVLSEQPGNGGETLKGVRIFSPSATAEDKLLLEKYDHCNSSNVTDFFKDKVKSVTFLRTIGDDSVLTDALVDELARRGADPLDPDNHIALISEWDTFYGRALPRTFIRSVKDKSVKKEKIEWIHRFSYLRGIDGQLPGGLHTDTSGSVSSENKNRDKETKALERPEGQGKFEYQRRLAATMEHCEEEIKREGKGRIKAIGVLGSDVYDKLLVLQALRDRFPGAVFFTTDLDASLLHPEEFKWTHNLVIASNFGLELHPELQKGVPPFRDNYQTSLFFSTIIALDGNQTRIREGILKEKWLQPRIFEVSRSGAFDLNINQKNDAKKIRLDILSNYLPSIHPLRPDLSPGTETRWAIASALLLAVVFFSLYTWHFRYLRVETSTRLPALYFSAFAVFGACVLTVTMYMQGYDGEPIALFEGISLWPTEFLRFFSGVLSLYFLYVGYRKIQDSDKTLSRFFVPKQTPSPGKRSLAERRVGNGRVDTVSLWKTYSQKSDPRRRFTRMILLGIVYFAFCGSIIHIFGRPFIPYRGDISLWVDRIVLFVFSVLPLIMLIFWIVDATKLSVWLISRISEEKTAWPESPTRCFGRALNIDPHYVNDCIDIRVIAKHSEVVGRLIYYPFLVFIVMLVSRSSCFDNWDMPLGLLIVILLGMAYAVYCAVILRRSAEKARRMAVERLWVKQVHAKGQGDGAKHMAEQIGLMIESIRSIRQGAFLPFFQQPLVQALALFFGSGGSLLLLEYVSWMK